MSDNEQQRQWTVDQIRQTFIDYFVEKQAHTFVPSSPVLLPNDPTLLFANAGMNQFKPLFLGTADPNSDFGKLKRAVNSQKCIRAGGKHNDLRDVGKDSYHHTFFEMLGSWSFGDYFKTECISWAWDLLVNVYKLDPNRLYATYFKGDEALGLEADEEARQEWLKYLPEERVLGAGAKENFWEMGATGPCGPCSEIHYDKVGDGYGLTRVNMDDPLVIEIWNLVFIQYVREEEGGPLKPLPAKHIDTGMGLERLSSILCQVPTNYDIDIFQKLISSVQRVTGCPTPYGGKYGAEDTEGIDMAYRIVADHIRTITVAISDGALPSNVGAGYVLRRVIRRAVRYGFERLGEKRGFFSELAPVVVELLGDAFPSLKANPERVTEIIKDEEMQFSRTLRLGLKKFNMLVQGKPEGFVIPGAETARLYHTYGFPFDLTRRMAKEKGMRVDKQAHLAAMEENAGAEASGKKKMELLALNANAISDLVEHDVPLTQDDAKHHLDETQPFTATLVAIWCGRIKGFYDFLDESFGKLAADETPDPENPKNHVGLIFDRTNFYAEQGGQIYDTGRISLSVDGKEAFSLQVESVQAYGGYIVHYGTPCGEVKTDDVLELRVDVARRVPITQNHTATHLCNFALRETLGAHVEQQGSLVLETRFRFDFTHAKPLAYEELHQVDSQVREKIAQDLPVYAKDVPLEVASRIQGVRQMFGEKYPDPVRVVSIGVPVEDLVADPDNEKWREYAIEFCGGTHSERLKEIRSFVTVSEDSISKGVRRIVCLTGALAVEALESAKAFEEKLDALKSVSGQELSSLVGELLKELDAMQSFPYAEKLRLRAVLGEQKKLALSQLKEQEKVVKDYAAELTKKVQEQLAKEPAKFLVLQEPLGGNVGLIKTTIKNIQKTHPTVPICVVSTGVPGKVSVVASTDKSNVKALPATEWVNTAIGPFNGRGGGKPDNAQGNCSINSDDDAAAITKAATEFAASKF